MKLAQQCMGVDVGLMRACSCWLLLVPSSSVVAPHLAERFPPPFVIGGRMSGKTGPTKSLTFCRHRFCFMFSRFNNGDSIASTVLASAQDEMYSWTRVSRVARGRS
jgi:hypothetical protein